MGYWPSWIAKGRRLVVGTHGKPELQLVTTTKPLKGLHKCQMIYAVKLNPIGKEPRAQGPEWLSKYDDVFFEEFTGFYY